jgi:divalent metal cation (Fe/Co/Zn/Cd) transporter
MIFIKLYLNYLFLVIKLILFFLCSRENSATLNALSQDHRNDVLSNTVALLCGILGMIYHFSINLI